MNKKNPAEIHAEFLREFNNHFQIAEISFKGDGLTFDTDHITFWLIKKGEESIYISPVGIESFKVGRKTNKSNDVIEIPIFTNDYAKKYRSLDLFYIISESFNLDRYQVETDLSEEETKRFFDIVARFLNFLGENTEKLLLDLHPNQLNSLVCASSLYTNIRSMMLKFKDNKQATEDIVKLMQEYEMLDKQDQSDKTKLGLMLDGSEQIANKYSIH